MLTIKVYAENDIEQVCQDVRFSSSAAITDADGILAYLSPVPELLSYNGLKAWYAFEKLSHSRFRRRGLWRECYQHLDASEFLHFAHPDLLCRVPHVTCAHESAFMVDGPHDRTRAIALVSNYGGNFWGLKKGVRLRNTFICHPHIDLYGQECWQDFRGAYGFGHKGPPDNFKGAPDVRWHSTRSHLELLAQYKVNVCLENSIEPYYFTEKFVNAVRAGCIPVYHAHPIVAETFLKGAKWVDPVNFNFNVSKTLEHALGEDLSAYKDANEKWLTSEQVMRTYDPAIWVKMADYFVERSRRSTNG